MLGLRARFEKRRRFENRRDDVEQAQQFANVSGFFGYGLGAAASARPLVAAHGNGLRQIHAGRFSRRGKTHQIVTVTQVLIAESRFFGAEKNRDASSMAQRRGAP